MPSFNGIPFRLIPQTLGDFLLSQQIILRYNMDDCISTRSKRLESPNPVLSILVLREVVAHGQWHLRRRKHAKGRGNAERGTALGARF